MKRSVLASWTYEDPDDFFWKVGVPMPADLSAAGFRPLAAATWTGADGRPAPPAAEVTFFCVSPGERPQLRALMQQRGLPAILEWIRQLQTAVETRRAMRHRLAVYRHGTEIACAEHSGWPPM